MATSTVTLGGFAPGQNFTYVLNTQSSGTYTVQVVDQGGTVLVNKTVSGVNWNFTTGTATVPSDSSRWPLNLVITTGGGNTPSVLVSNQSVASYTATYLNTYVVSLDDAGTGSDRDFNDLVVTLTAFRSAG